MKRDIDGTWSQEATASSTDDVALLRDAASDRAHVVAWPADVASTYTSPTFEAKAIPGTWQKLPATARHYGNAGIGTDGTVCLKASREFSVEPLTSVSNTEYACGKFASSTDSWNWTSFVSHPIGLRHAYDYLFPNPPGLPAGLYATSTRDIYKTASDVPNLAGFPYVFNGTRLYSTSLGSDATWQQWNTAEPITSKTGATVAPALRLVDSLIDSRGRIFSLYFADDPEDSSVRGFYVQAANASGATLVRSKWAVPSYGMIRLVEDGRQRLWLLWSNQGTRQTQVRLYPVAEGSASGSMTLSLGAYTDLGESFYPYSIQGVVIASPRGGNDRSMWIDALYDACTTTYTAGADFDNSSCYNADGTGRQRVFYVRVRLPD